jgi:hypothetical protein
MKLTNEQLLLLFIKILQDLLASFSSVPAELAYSRKSIPLFMTYLYVSLEPNK